jgi:hypothetical protein
MRCSFVFLKASEACFSKRIKKTKLKTRLAGIQLFLFAGFPKGSPFEPGENGNPD